MIRNCVLCLCPIDPPKAPEVPVCDSCTIIIANEPDLAIEVAKIMLWGSLVNSLERLVDEAEKRHTGPDDLFNGMN